MRQKEYRRSYCQYPTLPVHDTGARTRLIFLYKSRGRNENINYNPLLCMGSETTNGIF